MQTDWEGFYLDGRTAARQRARARLMRSGIEVSTEGGLTFLVEGGDAFIVKLLGDDRPALDGISVRRPTLDDVFLSLTGHRATDAEEDA